MASSYNKLISVVCLLAFLGCITYVYRSEDEASMMCQRTLQSKLLEWLSHVVYGMSCGHYEDSFISPEASRVPMLVQRAYSIWYSLNHPKSAAMYRCQVEWGFKIQFSVKTYHCESVNEKKSGVSLANELEHCRWWLLCHGHPWDHGLFHEKADQVCGTSRSGRIVHDVT